MHILGIQCRQRLTAHGPIGQFHLKVVALALVFILLLQTSAAKPSSLYQGCRGNLENELKTGENCATFMSVNLSNKKKPGFLNAPFKEAVEALVYLAQREEPDIILLQEASSIYNYTSKKASPDAKYKFENLFGEGSLKYISYEPRSKEEKEDRGNILLINSNIFESVGFTHDQYLLSPGNIGRWAAARLYHKSEVNHQFVAISYHGYSNHVSNSTSLCPPKSRDDKSKGKCVQNFVSEVKEAAAQFNGFNGKSGLPVIIGGDWNVPIHTADTGLINTCNYDIAYANSSETEAGCKRRNNQYDSFLTIKKNKDRVYMFSIGEVAHKDNLMHYFDHNPVVVRAILGR